MRKPSRKSTRVASAKKKVGREQRSIGLAAPSFVEEASRWPPDGGGASGQSATAQDAGGAQVADPGGGYILFADDNADARDHVRLLLAGRYRLETVADGQAALRLARKHPPDLVLSDIVMPELDGLALLRALRADPRTRDVPIILLSAHAGEESKLEGLDAGADDYLVKPFTARELYARVKAQLGLARGRRRSADTLAARVVDLEKANAHASDSRRATLNVLEDAVAARDLSERLYRDLQERDAWQRGQREALAAAVEGEPLPASLSKLVHTAVEAMGDGTRAAFYLANGDGTSLHHVVGMGAAYAKAVDGFQIGPESLACGLATHLGEAVLTRDVQTDARWEPWRWLAEQFDYRGCWSFPVHTAAGKFVGTLAVYSRQPREASARDRELASLLTDTAAIIIARHTESAKRKKAEEALRESEKRFSPFVTATADAIYRMNPDWSEMRALDGHGFLSDAPAPTEAWMNRYIHPDDQAYVAAAVERAVRGKTVFELEHRVRQMDESFGWTLSRAIPILDEHGEIVEWMGAASKVKPRRQTQGATRETTGPSASTGWRWDETSACTELKEQVNALLARLGEPPRYPLACEDAKANGPARS